MDVGGSAGGAWGGVAVLAQGVGVLKEEAGRG